MIGGENYFPFPMVEDNFLDLFQPAASRTQFFASGRDTLFSLFQHLAPRRIWYPNFLCESIYSPLAKLGTPLLPYAIGEDLRAPLAWMEQTNPGDAVLVLHYFGREQRDLLMALQGRGLTVVSDATHLLLSEDAWNRVCRDSQWVVGSLRKSGPFPDGGFCIGPSGAVLPAVERPARTEVWVPRAAAFLTRGASMAKGYINDESYPLIAQSERLLDESFPGSYAMSFLSLGLLESMGLRQKRASVLANTRFLLDSVPPELIHPISTQGPGLYFICRYPEPGLRNRVRDCLAKERIHLPVHWQTVFLNPPHPLSGQLLSIPCDDRYGEDELGHVVTRMRGIR